MICAEACPNPGVVWRFPVDAYAGSQNIKDMRWVEVIILPGQGKCLFAARPELGILGAAPVIYVSDSRPTTVKYWFYVGEYTPGYYQEVYAPPVLVRDAWGRAPAKASVGHR